MDSEKRVRAEETEDDRGGKGWRGVNTNDTPEVIRV